MVHGQKLPLFVIITNIITVITKYFSEQRYNIPYMQPN